MALTYPFKLFGPGLVSHIFYNKSGFKEVALCIYNMIFLSSPNINMQKAFALFPVGRPWLAERALTSWWSDQQGRNAREDFEGAATELHHFTIVY